METQKNPIFMSVFILAFPHCVFLLLLTIANGKVKQGKQLCERQEYVCVYALCIENPGTVLLLAAFPISSLSLAFQGAVPGTEMVLKWQWITHRPQQLCLQHCDHTEVGKGCCSLQFSYLILDVSFLSSVMFLPQPASTNHLKLT